MARNRVDPSRFRALLAERGPSDAATLRTALGSLSQPTFSRLVRATGDHVLRLGGRRNALYAARRTVVDLGSRWPLFEVGHDGNASQIAELVAVEPRGFAIVDWTGSPEWARGTTGRGLFDGLPFFLHDMRPQGFLGRAAAARLAEQLGLPARLNDWQAHHILAYLTRAGEDAPGCYIVGTQAYERFERRRLAGLRPLGRRGIEARYAALARDATDGGMPGSSAGGEQPKFATAIEGSDGPRHVIVKYSPDTKSRAGRRVADLLLCEHLAGQILGDADIDCCRSRIVDGERQRFLEVERFDRTGTFGRRMAVSLLAFDIEYIGALDAWPNAGSWLAERRWLSKRDADRLSLAWLFAGFIANNDVHFGNVSLLASKQTLKLAPVYDMLPMLYAPRGTELPERPYRVPVPLAGDRTTWQQAGLLGEKLWREVAESRTVSSGFRAIARKRTVDVRRALDALG